MLNFFKINCVFFMRVFPVIAMQRFDLTENNIIAIKLFLVMILNLYLTSE